MNIDQTTKRVVFIQWMRNCQNEFEQFQSRIYTQFQKIFAELEQSYENKYQRIIQDQQGQIRQLKSKLSTFQKIQKLISGTQDNNDPNSNNIQAQIQQSFQQQRDFHQQEQQQQIGSDRRFDENEQIQSQKQQNPPQLQRNPKQWGENRHLDQQHEEQQKIERQQPQFAQRDDSLSVENQQQSHHVQTSPQKQQRPRLLPPLQRRKNHYMCKASLTPNFTPISFIEYKPYQTYTFDQNNIQYLLKHDLRQVQSIKIQTLEMNDEFFERLTTLQWGNIISVQVDGNCLTKLEPIKNLPYNKFVNLDVSSNELNTSSALFLTSTQFDQLIYLTLSFKTGINKQCWQILLRNMSNFPKLQAIDICSSNQLNDEIIDRIKQCMRLKSIEQRKRQVINEKGQKVNYYPENYEIKIKWQQSQEMHKNMSKKQVEQMTKKWREQVKYNQCNVPKLNRQKESPNKRLSNKRKFIHKNK